MSDLKKFPTVQVDDFVTREVLSDSADLMVVSFSFKKGGKGDLHNHIHVQSTYVESGEFRFTIEDREFTVKAGDSFVIPSNATHGCVCLEAGRLIDNFTPRREDFL